MPLAGRHAEYIREVGAVESVAQVQLADLPVHRVQPVQGGAHLDARFRLRGDGGKYHRVVYRMGRLTQPHRKAGSLPAELALIAGQREQPRPQLVRLTQTRNLGRGDDEGVPHGVG